MRYFYAENILLPEGWKQDVKLTIDGNGNISKVSIGEANETSERIGKYVLPGLPNVHSHAFQRGLAGLTEFTKTDSDNFMSWRKIMYDFANSLKPEDVEVIASLLYAEMLEAGFTSVGEFHYLHHNLDGTPYNDIAEIAGRITNAALMTGINLTLFPVYFACDNFGKSTFNSDQRRFANSLDNFIKLWERTHRYSEILVNGKIGIAPHSLRTVPIDDLRVLLEIAENCPIHIHIAEQISEVNGCLENLNARPVEVLLDKFDLSNQWCLIHATHMTPQETTNLAKSGVTVCLCPITEANLGDGFFNAQEYLSANGIISIGSDSNIFISVAEELRLFEYGCRLKSNSRNGCNIHSQSIGEYLYLNCLKGGMTALGQTTNGIEVDSSADLIVLDDKHPNFAGRACETILDSWIFAGDKSCISDVYVRGRKLVENGRHFQRSNLQFSYCNLMETLLNN